MDNKEKARELINKHLYFHGDDGLRINNDDVYKAISVINSSDIPKYTEEQVRKAIEMAREPEYWDNGSYWGELYTEDEIINKLNSGD